jgi:tonB-dependent receptor, plug
MAFAQQTVIGSVKDSKGKPVAGASVLVVGTSRTATTSAEGAYSIEAVAEETLQFSAQGYQNVQRKVGLETTIDVVLALVSEDAKTVGALGIECDANAKGYSDTTLEGGDDLKGKTAGLAAVGSGMGQTKMTLRGTSSVAGSSQPLIVIDGVPMA